MSRTSLFKGRQEVLPFGLVGMDESLVSVLDDKLKETSHRGYIWTMGSQDAVARLFDAGRSGRIITWLLGEAYSGYVVADGKSDRPSPPQRRSLISATNFHLVRWKGHFKNGYKCSRFPVQTMGSTSSKPIGDCGGGVDRPGNFGP